MFSSMTPNTIVNLAFLGDTQHWIIGMFFYLQVAELGRRAKGFNGTHVYNLAVLTAMGFGGGIINPIILGHDSFFPFPMGSDVVVPCICAAYLFVWITNDSILGLPISTTPGLSHLRFLAFELVRSKLIHGWCVKSNSIIPASNFPSGPVFGVLVAGLVGGCGGLFLISGLSPIKDSVPWPVESAGTASLIHFLFSRSILVLPVSIASLLQLSSTAEVAHLVVIVFLVLTRLVPTTRNFLPWRLLSKITTSAASEDKKKKKQTGQVRDEGLKKKE